MEKLLVVCAMIMVLGILVAVDFVATTSALAQIASNTTKGSNMTNSTGNMTASGTGQISRHAR